MELVPEEMKENDFQRVSGMALLECSFIKTNVQKSLDSRLLFQ